jgi:hypothetical protein
MTEEGNVMKINYDRLASEIRWHMWYSSDCGEYNLTEWDLLLILKKTFKDDPEFDYYRFCDLCQPSNMEENYEI